MSAAPFTAQIARVWCPSCGFSGGLLTSDRETALWTQLAGFMRCNGCPECWEGLHLADVGFVDVLPVGGRQK